MTFILGAQGFVQPEGHGVGAVFAPPGVSRGLLFKRPGRSRRRPGPKFQSVADLQDEIPSHQLGRIRPAPRQPRRPRSRPCRMPLALRIWPGPGSRVALALSAVPCSTAWAMCSTPLGSRGDPCRALRPNPTNPRRPAMDCAISGKVFVRSTVCSSQKLLPDRICFAARLLPSIGRGERRVGSD